MTSERRPPRQSTPPDGGELAKETQITWDAAESLKIPCHGVNIQGTTRWFIVTEFVFLNSRSQSLDGRCLGRWFVLGIVPERPVWLN